MHLRTPDPQVSFFWPQTPCPGISRNCPKMPHSRRPMPVLMLMQDKNCNTRRRKSLGFLGATIQMTRETFVSLETHPPPLLLSRLCCNLFRSCSGYRRYHVVHSRFETSETANHCFLSLAQSRRCLGGCAVIAERLRHSHRGR